MKSHKTGHSFLSTLSVLTLAAATFGLAGCDVWGAPDDGVRPGKDSVADVDLCTLNWKHGCDPGLPPDDIKK